jgi:hypothetical protein
MSGGGVSDDDMPIFLWSSRGVVPPVGDPAFDALLTGNLPPEDTADGLRPVAEAIAALNAVPVTSELAAEAGALTVFRAAGGSGASVRPRRRRRLLLTSLLSAKLAAAAVAVTLSGAAAAAYTGALPAPAQKLAHAALGAPAAHSTARPTAQPTRPATPVGPDPTGSAAYGLCTAYAHLKAHGSAAEKAVAFRNLATAAGGAANVTAFCAKTAHPGPTPSARPPAHRTGKPATLPSRAPATHPIGKPTAHPTGKPATPPSQVPSTHPTGKPPVTS